MTEYKITGTPRGSESSTWGDTTWSFVRGMRVWRGVWLVNKVFLTVNTKFSSRLERVAIVQKRSP